jgi:hypothetical protein
MNRGRQSWPVPILSKWRGMRFDRPRQVVIVMRSQRFGRVVVGNAEIAFGRVARCVSRRMHGHAHVPNEEREENCQADTVSSETHRI